MTLRVIPMLDPIVQPIRNVIAGQVFNWGAGVNGFGAGYSRTQFPRDSPDGPPGGGTYTRATVATANTPTAGVDLFTFNGGNFGISTFAMSFPESRIGVPWSIATWVRSNIAQTVRLQAQGIAYAAGSTIKIGPDVTLIPGVWTPLVVENWSAQPHVNPCLGCRIDVDLGQNTRLPWGVSDWLDVSRPVAVQSATMPSPFPDGSFPGWRWLGGTDASESVGYPYTLESVGGQPVATNSTPGSSVPTPGLSEIDGRTLYVVHDTVVPVSDSQAIAIVGAAANQYNQNGVVGSMAYRHNTGGGTVLRVMNRANSLTGSIQFVSSPGATNGTGRHVGVSWMLDGDLGFGVMQDGTVDAVATQVSSGGLANPTLGLSVAGAASSPVIAHLFKGVHNRETRLRITAWLARKYGSPIPAGY